MILYQWLDCSFTIFNHCQWGRPHGSSYSILIISDHTSYSLSLSLSRKSVWLHGAPWSTSRPVVMQWHRCQAYPRPVAFTVNFCNFKQRHVLHCLQKRITTCHSWRNPGILAAVRYKMCQPWSLDSGTILGYMWI